MELVSATRVWGAVECIRKVGLQRETSLAVASGPDQKVVRLRAGGAVLISLEALIQGTVAPVVISVLARDGDARV